MPTHAIALLESDHVKVRKLLAQLEKAQTANRRKDLLDRIASEIEDHMRIEEEIFYPAFQDAARKKDDKKLYFEAQAEHGVVKFVLPDLQDTDPSSDEFAGKAKVLKDLIEHHAGEEESELFPRARALMSKDELQELGGQMEERRSALGAARE